MSERLPRPLWALLLPLFAAAVLLATTPPAAAQLPTDTYRVRPGEILACGGFAGGCRAMTLEGTMQLAVSVPGDGGHAAVEIVASELRVRSADGTGGAFAFPAGGDLPLTALEDDPATAELVLTSPDGAAQGAELRLTPVAPDAFMLRGSYDEGCCDRFVYELDNLLFEAQGAAPEDALVLGAGRFRVEVDWQDFEGGSGAGTPAKMDERSGRFWFFSPSNPELLVKLLDGCPVNGHYWFFAAGLTNVGVEIRVTDTAAPATNSYTNPLGRQFPPVLDTTAFPCVGATG